MASGIEKIFIQAVKQPTQDLKKKQLNKFIIEVKKLRDQIDKMQKTMLFYENERKRLISLGFSKETASHYMLNAQHLDIGQFYQQGQLQEKALQGYQLIQKLRQQLTNEPIVYQIGIGSKKKEKLLETTITYDELEPMFYMERRADGYAIRIKLSQRKIMQLNKERKAKFKTEVDTVNIFTAGASTLYSQVYRYFSNNRLTQKGNWGNFYQVYRSLVHSSPEGNKWKPPVEIIMNSFKRVLSGGGTSGSFATGGDQGLEQDKASFGSNPTLTSVNTIINTLDSLIISLQDFINTSNDARLIKLFTGINLNKEIVDIGKEYAIDSLRSQLNKFLT